MEIFELIRKHLSMCGIEISHKSPSKNHSFNVKNSTVFILVCATASLIAVAFNDTDTFDEHIDILFRSISIGTSNIIYGIIIWKSSKLFEFINILAEIVKASE